MDQKVGKYLSGSFKARTVISRIGEWASYTCNARYRCWYAIYEYGNLCIILSYNIKWCLLSFLCFILNYHILQESGSFCNIFAWGDAVFPCSTFFHNSSFRSASSQKLNELSKTFIVNSYSYYIYCEDLLPLYISFNHFNFVSYIRTFCSIFNCKDGVL